MKPLNQQINRKLLNHARKLAQYTQLLQKILPIECRNHVEVANIRNQNLMLITDSPVWTTKLRQLSPQILQFVRESSVNTGNDDEQVPIIHHVQISTRYSAASADQMNPRQRRIMSEREKQRPQISKKTAELLSQSANSLDHQPLKAALLNLARHGKPDDCTSKNKK